MLTFAELEISNLAKIHSLEPTPPIAIGEGNVVTARMTTRQTHQLVRVQFSDQTTLIGTPAHPIWSVCEQDWVDLEELMEGDLVLGESGRLEVVSTELIETLEPVYNLEVYGEHVYVVENSGILVHNGRRLGYKGPKAKKVREWARPGWKSRRRFRDGDSGLKDHARRHSDLTPDAYLRRGQENVLFGKRLKGGAKYPKANYYVRRVGPDAYSVTITNNRGEIISIDTWTHGGVPISKAIIIKGLERSGVTPPKDFF